MTQRNNLAHISISCAQSQNKKNVLRRETKPHTITDSCLPGNSPQDIQIAYTRRARMEDTWDNSTRPQYYEPCPYTETASIACYE